MSDIPPISSGAEFISEQEANSNTQPSDSSVPESLSGISNTIDSIESVTQNSSETDEASDSNTE